MRSRPLLTSFSTLPGGTRSNRETTPTLTFYLTTLRLSRLGGTMRDTTTSYFSSPAFSTAYPNLFKVSAENSRTITSSGASSPICLTSKFSHVPAQKSNISKKNHWGEVLNFFLSEDHRRLLLFARLSYYFTPYNRLTDYSQQVHKLTKSSTLLLFWPAGFIPPPND